MRPAWESGAGFGALAVAGVFALNYPLLSLFDRDTLVLGIPLPFLHVFLVWVLLIAGLAVLCEYRSKRAAPADTPRQHSHDNGEPESSNNVTAPVSGQRHDTED